MITIAKLGGEAGLRVKELFRQLNETQSDIEELVDRFCLELRANAAIPPVIHFCQWIDPWLVPPNFMPTEPVTGKRFEACYCSPSEARNCAANLLTLKEPFQEHEWLIARLNETVDSWHNLVPDAVIVIVREVFGPSPTDEEVLSSLATVPEWLSRLQI